MSGLPTQTQWLTLLLLITSPIGSADAGESSHAVIVCPRAWQGQLKPWIEQRAHGGISATVVAPESDAASTLRAIRKASRKQTRYVVLVGDAPAIGDLTHPKQPIPIHYTPTRVTAAWNSTKTLASDWFYGDLDQDGSIDAAVGRLPVHSAAELAIAIKKQSLHEADLDFGPWRDQVDLIGGVGGFGMLIDTAIESVSRNIVTNVLPSHVVTRVRYGSEGHRFFPTHKSFTETVLEDYSRGARFWVYAGHGQVTQLDRVPQTVTGQPVLDRNTLDRLHRDQSHRPIAMLLACYTGALDAREDCFAENMWKQPGGPVAVFAGSRVTMPYGNTTAAMGMIDAVYNQHLPRLGDAWLFTLRELEKANPEQGNNTARLMVDGLAGLVSPAGTDLTEERKEHARLYNLIGDPTLRLRHGESIELEIESGFDPGVPITLHLESSIDGLLTLTLAKPLGAITAGDANELTIQTQQVPIVADRRIHFSIPLTEKVKGSIVIHAHVEGSKTWASGATTTHVRQ